MDSLHPTELALSILLAHHEWEDAAMAAGSLSGSHLVVGHMTEAINFAKQSVELMDIGGSDHRRCDARTRLADALHQSGQIPQADRIFSEAEHLQRELNPRDLFLFSIGGYRYCDLLLSKGDHQGVIQRATYAMQVSKENKRPLGVALDHISLGRAYLLKEKHNETADYAKAAMHLDQGVEGVRQASILHYLPHGLIARAELHRRKHDFEKAYLDLKETEQLVFRGDMRLQAVDCNIEYTWFHLAQRQCDVARLRLESAERMVQQMGYHRRDTEIADLKREMSAGC